MKECSHRVSDIPVYVDLPADASQAYVADIPVVQRTYRFSSSSDLVKQSMFRTRHKGYKPGAHSELQGRQIKY
jgi:hypothetical protein